MKIIVLADIHSCLEPLEKMKKPLSEADVVLLAGDITNFGGTQQARAVLETLSRYAPRILGVPGNCDTPMVDAYLTKTGVNLHGRAVSLDGWCFVGAGGTLPELGPVHNEAGERLFARTLNQGLSQCQDPDRLILVTHQPPWNTALDRRDHQRHIGNHAIRAFIDHAHPRLAVSGHLHEIIGTDRLGTTTLVNPGPARDSHYVQITLTDSNLDIQLV